MTSFVRSGRLGLAAAAGAGLALLLATPAAAHPLGNFSVNQYVGLTVHPDAVAATVAVDYAEIPTLQEQGVIDRDGDGVISAPERAARAAAGCAEVAGAVTMGVGGRSLVWTVTDSTFGYSPGAGGLEVSRLNCALRAPADLGASTRVSVDNGYLSDRVGWRELTAVGVGIGLTDSTVPTRSISDELRAYPQDLLASALDVRSGTFTATAATASGPAPELAGLTAGGDPISRWMAAVDRRFQDLAGGDLTPWVGLLAVLLAILLGAGHAALPGHGKTVLAAYLAGKQGRPRDALAVAGTVTVAHTGGVLVVGLLLTATTALAGPTILNWLGLVSGLLVLAVGATMVLGLIRRRRAAHHYQDHHQVHHQGHPHHHHDHHGHDHAHGHHHHDHDHDHDHGRARSRRVGLAGIGVAGGLVPSPSALVVLLAAIGLGRTAFGVGLVIAYGLGMAATLAGAGLLLVVVQRRLAGVAERAGAAGTVGFTTRLTAVGAWLHTATPAATAALVLLVGAGLAARAATAVA